MDEGEYQATRRLPERQLSKSGREKEAVLALHGEEALCVEEEKATSKAAAGGESLVSRLVRGV